MRFALVVIESLLLVAAGNTAFGSPYSRAPKSSSSEATTPIVVELFTSEGCSSCPPADALLAKLEATQPIAGTQVIAIEEHVDYWNQQGWTDPFSSSNWTARQQEYSFAFRQPQVFTPQMIVGGRSQLIGSRQDEVLKAIQKAGSVAPVTVSIVGLSAQGSSEGRLTVSVGKLDSLSTGDSAEVWLMITESGLTSQVTAGENAGRSLRHASVLRLLRRLGAADSKSAGDSYRGDAAFKLKPEWKAANLSAVVVVQEKKSRHILGAAIQKLPG